MPIYRLAATPVFPDPADAEPSGLLAVGGDLSPTRLLTAYQQGIFPWYSEGQPLLWWSPDPRMVLDTEALHVPRSLRKRMKRGDFTFTLDTAFAEVLRACAKIPRRDQDGTWLTEAMIDAYVRLHELGHAHSCEAWQDGALVGGLYGVSVGGVFCGESMFARAPDASKAAFVRLVQQLRDWGVRVVDCQVYTDHLARFGAVEVPRAQFLQDLRALRRPLGRVGVWRFDDP